MRRTSSPTHRTASWLRLVSYFESEVQKLTDRFVKSVDDHLKHKEAEVMKV